MASAQQFIIASPRTAQPSQFETETPQAVPSQDAGSRKRIWFLQGAGLAGLMLIGVFSIGGLEKSASHDDGWYRVAGFFPTVPGVRGQTPWDFGQDRQARASSPAMQAHDTSMVYSRGGNAGPGLDKIDRDAEEARMREEKRTEEYNARERKIALLRDIPDATPAGTVSDFMFKQGVNDILEQLDYDMIGLKPVKARVREIASLLVVDKMRLKLGLETSVPSLHMSFTGPPGTGKTTVALRMGQLLQRMGYCRSGHVVVATRDDLVGQYVGHTAPKTKEMVKKAMGGILLVDEAYYLYNAGNDRDYGQESIEILLNVMENNKEDLIVILAGYKDRMDSFFSFIPGMASRIGNHIEFPNYEVDELVDIGKVMCRDLEYNLGEGSEQALREYLYLRMQLPFFSNARTVRNAIDLGRMRAAIRVFNEKIEPTSDGMVNEMDLSTIMPSDFQLTEKEAEDLENVRNPPPAAVAAPAPAPVPVPSPAYVAPVPAPVPAYGNSPATAGKASGGGEATRDPEPTLVDPNDPKGKQQAIHKAESFADYMAKRR